MSSHADVFKMFDKLSRGELLRMISGYLSVPHAQRGKQQLVRFIIENGSEELLQNLKEKAEKKVGKRRERSQGEFVNRKRVCVQGIR